MDGVVLMPFRNRTGFENKTLYPLYSVNISRSFLSFPIVYMFFGSIFSFRLISFMPSLLFIWFLNET